MADLKATTIRGDLDVKGKVNAPSLHPVNSIFITSDRTNPKDIFGYGEWTLIDKLFKNAYNNFSGENDASKKIFQPTARNAAGDWRFKKDSNYRVGYIRQGHSIRLRIGGTPSTQWEYGTDITLGVVNFKNLGANGIATSFGNHPGGNQANHSVMLADLYNGDSKSNPKEYTTYENGKKVTKKTQGGEGALVRKDIIRYAYQGGGPAGTTITDGPVYWDFSIVVPQDLMIDDYCDKFFWKRIK